MKIPAINQIIDFYSNIIISEFNKFQYTNDHTSRFKGRLIVSDRFSIFKQLTTEDMRYIRDLNTSTFSKGYSIRFGEFKNSPIVSIRGDKESIHQGLPFETTFNFNTQIFNLYWPRNVYMSKPVFINEQEFCVSRLEYDYKSKNIIQTHWELDGISKSNNVQEWLVDNGLARHTVQIPKHLRQLFKLQVLT